MAPLGVLTAFVGAIRIGGASWLKRLIGRARENFADAEIELMSSVSKEVCELWNGRSIVRSRGNPQVKQIIHVPAEDGDISPESFITMDPATWSKESHKWLFAGDEMGKKHTKSKISAKGSLIIGSSLALSENADGNKTNLKTNIKAQNPTSRHSKSEVSAKGSHIGSSKPLSENVEDNNNNNKNLKADIEAQTPKVTGRSNGDNGPPSTSKSDTPEPEDITADEYKELPPNISLNIHGGSNPTEVRACAAFAAGLQAGVLVWSWYAGKYKLSAIKPMVGFWLHMIGTLVLTFSLIACAGIIDHGSRERRWSSKQRIIQSHLMSILLRLVSQKSEYGR